MTTSTKRSLQRGVLSLLESAAWSTSPWRSIHEIQQSVDQERGEACAAHTRPHEHFRECLEKLARYGLIKMKGDDGARLYRAAFSPVWSLAPKEAHASRMLAPSNAVAPGPALGSGASSMAS